MVSCDSYFLPFFPFQENSDCWLGASILPGQGQRESGLLEAVCSFSNALFLLDRMFRLRFLPVAAGLAAVSRRYHGAAQHPRTRRRLVVAAFIGTTAVTASARLLWQR